VTVRALVILTIFICFLSASPLSSQVIRSIELDQRDVFDPRHDDWFFGASVFNALHSLTNPYVIEDEFLFDVGDELDTAAILESERNLRRIGCFSLVRISVDTINEDSVDIHVFAQDRFSLNPAVIFRSGGGITNLGFELEESNFLGNVTYVGTRGLYRTENDIGWEGYAALGQRRLFRTELGLWASILANRYRTDQALSVYKPFRTMATPTAFSVDAVNAYGQDFVYTAQDTVLTPFQLRQLTAWHSWAEGKVDRVFFTMLGHIERVTRFAPEYRQAFDNTGRLLFAFSSIGQEFGKTVNLNGYETEDVQMKGGWGTVILGRLFSLGNGGNTMWYVGGQGEQSGYVSRDVYLFGRVGAGTGFAEGRPRYTALEIGGIGHWRITPAVVLAARYRSETAWNWDAYRQLILDNDAGLRGYPVNQLAGDNRMVSNIEFRYLPGWKFWALGFSAAAFWDMGTVWNQGIDMFKTRMHHAVGLGFRIHNYKASGNDAIFRFDFAFNIDENRFAGLTFSTNQLFSAFGSHFFKAPAPFGSDIDLQ
jgi:hypothetical protein